MDIQKEVEKIFGESDILVLDRKPRDSSIAVQRYQELVIVIRKGESFLEIEDKISGDNAIPMSRWNGFEKHYRIASSKGGPGVLNKESVSSFITDLADDIDAIADGFEEDVWDGQNYRPVLSDAARSAHERMEDMEYGGMRQLFDNTWAVFDADQWLTAGATSKHAILETAGIGLDASDEQIEEAAERSVSEAYEDKVILDKRDVMEQLLETIKKIKEEEEEDSEKNNSGSAPMEMF